MQSAKTVFQNKTKFQITELSPACYERGLIQRKTDILFAIGWRSWLSLAKSTYHQPNLLLPSYHQQAMIKLAFLLETLKSDFDNESVARMLTVGISARTIANFAQRYLADSV